MCSFFVFLCVLFNFQFEVREDEEQSLKLTQTIELLLAAGYFRARIKGLSPFDKVSYVNFDPLLWSVRFPGRWWHDLVHHNVQLWSKRRFTLPRKLKHWPENVSLLKYLWSLLEYFLRSALTEKIVAVLPRMKCPHRIEPHQIQGLDFIHIFPVVQVGYSHYRDIKIIITPCWTVVGEESHWNQRGVGWLHSFLFHFSVPKASHDASGLSWRLLFFGGGSDSSISQDVEVKENKEGKIRAVRSVSVSFVCWYRSVLLLSWQYLWGL